MVIYYPMVDIEKNKKNKHKWMNMVQNFGILGSSEGPWKASIGNPPDPKNKSVAVTAGWSIWWSVLACKACDFFGAVMSFMLLGNEFIRCRMLIFTSVYQVYWGRVPVDINLLLEGILYLHKRYDY